MKRAFGQFFALALASLQVACIDFESQTSSYRYDKASDELRIFQNYQGIFGTGTDGRTSESLTDKELSELKSVLEGQRTFFFNNWIVEYDRELLLKFQSRLKDPDQSEIAAGDRPDVERLLDLALDNVRIVNGPFYLGADGKLCGVQSVTVAKCSEIITSLNSCMPVFLRSYAEDEGTTPDDRKAVAAFQASDDTSLIHRDGNAMRLRWPMSRATFNDTFGAGSDNPHYAKELQDAGVGVSWKEGVADFTVGKQGDEITEVTLRVNRSNYIPNAIGSARAEHRIQKPFDVGAASKDFLLSRADGD